jgi:glycosyltransferase involved in cell wall biosynthesis
MFVVVRSSGDPAVAAISRPMDFANRLRRGIRQYRIEQEFRSYRHSRPAGCEVFTDDRTEYAQTLLTQLPGCDVINLHWVSGFLDYQSFFRHVPRLAPVVWTLHDMNAFTGGCHYNLACARYLDRCGACPQLGSADEHDLASAIWRRKSAAFSQLDPSRLNIVAPSRWLASEAKRSSLLSGFPVTVIPYGLDVKESFVPRNREAVRNLLGIPRDARVVLFLAETTNAPRKGLELLIESVSRSAGEVSDLFLLSLGGTKPEADITVPSMHLGSLDNERFLSMVYSAADVYVMCSVQDNMPNTVLEAMACGLPVVGVEVGGIPDMVRKGINGITVPGRDPQAVASAISQLLKDKNLCKKMGTSSRQIAVDEYSLELQATRYAELYQTLSGAPVGIREVGDRLPVSTYEPQQNFLQR